MILQQSGQPVPQGGGGLIDLDGGGEHPYNERARAQARASTQADQEESMGKLLSRFFDYDIVAEFFETGRNGHLYKKYVRKYKLRRRKKA